MRASQFVSIFKRDNGAGFAYDSDYQAVLDKGTALGYTLPTDAQKLIQNQLVLDLKAASIWTKLDIFYVFANNGSKEFATLNWKNPNAHQATLVNSPTFTSNVGFNSDGVSAYINLNFNASTQAVQATTASASKFVYKSANSGTAWVTGINGATQDRWQAGNTVGWSIHAAQNASVSADTTAAGVHMVSRSSSTAINHRSPTISTNATVTLNTLPTAYHLFTQLAQYSSTTMKLYVYGYGANMESDFSTIKSLIDGYVAAL